MIEIAPRLTWNENLARDYFKAKGVESTSPPVFQQLKSVVINHKALPNFSYNGSIAFYKGRYWLAFRHHPTNTAVSELGIAELDEKFNVKNHKKVVLVPSPPSAEDAKLFVFHGELHMSWVESNWPVKATSVVKYGLLADDGSAWRIVGVVQPAIGQNDGEHMEKNFVFFEHEKQLFCLYQSHHDQIIFNLSDNNSELRSPGLQWRYGPIRGGCILPYKDKLLRFFHSGIDTYPRPWYRRYFVGYAWMEPKPPFTVIECSKEFLVQGSEVSDLPKLEENKSSHMKGNVVFPMSAIIRNGVIWLSCGINDTGIALLKIEL